VTKKTLQSAYQEKERGREGITIGGLEKGDPGAYAGDHQSYPVKGERKKYLSGNRFLDKRGRKTRFGERMPAKRVKSSSSSEKRARLAPRGRRVRMISSVQGDSAGVRLEKRCRIDAGGDYRRNRGSGRGGNEILPLLRDN